MDDSSLTYSIDSSFIKRTSVNSLEGRIATFYDKNDKINFPARRFEPINFALAGFFHNKNRRLEKFTTTCYSCSKSLGEWKEESPFVEHYKRKDNTDSIKCSLYFVNIVFIRKKTFPDYFTAEEKKLLSKNKMFCYKIKKNLTSLFCFCCGYNINELDKNLQNKSADTIISDGRHTCRIYKGKRKFWLRLLNGEENTFITKKFLSRDCRTIFKSNRKRIILDNTSDGDKRDMMKNKIRDSSSEYNNRYSRNIIEDDNSNNTSESVEENVKHKKLLAQKRQKQIEEINENKKIPIAAKKKFNSQHLKFFKRFAFIKTFMEEEDMNRPLKDFCIINFKKIIECYEKLFENDYNQAMNELNK